jgi:hypothetical protein
MAATHHRFLPATALLSAALAWLFSVTLCSVGMFAETSDEHPVTSEHSGHADRPHAPAHEHGGKSQDDGCDCVSFKAFPAQAAALAKAPIPPAAPLLYTILLDGFAYESAATTVTAQATGPPGRQSFAEQIRQQCLHSHAPPFVV